MVIIYDYDPKGLENNMEDSTQVQSACKFGFYIRVNRNTGTSFENCQYLIENLGVRCNYLINASPKSL